MATVLLQSVDRKKYQF